MALWGPDPVIIRSLAWMGLAQALSFILQAAASVVLARFLTPYEMGIYAVAVATASSLAIVQAMGLQSLIVREEQISRSLSTTAFTVNAVMGLTLSGLIVLASYFGGSLFHDNGVRRVLLILALNPLFGILEFLPAANLERAGQFKTMSLVSMASYITGTIVTITLACLGYRYMSVAYAQVAALGMSAVLFNLVGWRHVRFALGVKDWRRVASFGLQVLTTTGVNSITRRMSDIVLGRLIGLTALGVFNRAGNLQNLLWTNIYIVLSRVLLVDFAELNRKGISLRPRYIVAMECFTALLWPAFMGFAVLAGPFLHLVYGDRWLAAAHPLVLLCLASACQVSMAMTFEVFVARGELGTQTRIEIYKSLLFMPIFVAACFVSVEAAAATRILDAVMSMLLYRRALNRATETRMRDLLPGYLRSAVLTILAVGPALALMASQKMDPRAPIAMVAASAVLGMICWIVGLMAMRHPLLQKILAVVGPKLASLHRLRAQTFA